MPKQAEYTWMAKKNFDNIDYLEQDAKEFKNLLYSSHGIKKENTKESVEEILPGAILRGTIVDISKDFIVVDVGLKSEGVIPMAEFVNSSEGLEVGAEVEVYLDQAEDEEG
ncbi:MAG: S1 RNA-binding domain-containing protein, partial [Victivallaceae bacterium]